MGFFEHSKKAGRIVALIITLSIAGTISIAAIFLSAVPVDTAKELLPTWMLVVMAIIHFYFEKQREATP